RGKKAWMIEPVDGLCHRDQVCRTGWGRNGFRRADLIAQIGGLGGLGDLTGAGIGAEHLIKPRRQCYGCLAIAAATVDGKRAGRADGGQVIKQGIGIFRTEPPIVVGGVGKVILEPAHRVTPLRPAGRSPASHPSSSSGSPPSSRIRRSSR